MAFPADYTLLVEYDLPTITGTHTNFVALLKYDDFNVGDALDFWDNGGGDLRISDDINGTTQLPIEVVEFDKVGLSAQVWVKIPSAFTGKTIYLWGNNTGDSQPAVTDAYGRNAVWSDDAFRTHMGATTPVDSTGNHTGFTANATTLTTGLWGDALDFNGTSSDVDLGTPLLPTGDFTQTVWVNPDALGGYQGIFGAWVSGDAGRTYIGTNGTNMNWDGYATFTNDRAGLANNNWQMLTVTRTGSTVTMFIDGAPQGATITDAGTPTATNNTFIGALSNGTQYFFNGQISEISASNLYKNNNYIATEYDNQSTAGAWGTPTRVGGGGATYTINTETSNISYSTGQHSVELSGLIEATTQTTSVSYVTGQHSIDLTGAIDVLSQTNTIDYASGQHNVSLSGLINPTTTTGVITYATGQHEIDLTGVINTVTNTSDIVYSSGQHIVEIGGQIVALSDTSDINYSTGQHNAVLQGLIDVTTESNIIAYTTGQHIVYTQEPVRLTTFSASYKGLPFTASYKNSTITARYKT